MKNFYSSLKEIYSPTSIGSFPMLSADGTTLITEKDKVLERWAEHFDRVLNRPSSINDEAIERLPQVPTNATLDATPTLDEVQKAIQLPQDFKDATIIHFYKHKGNRQAWDSHRGISLFSIAGKILARVILNCLHHHLEQDLLPESQYGFRKERGTVDMIFAARQLQEKCQEQNIDLYSTYIDLTKAFETVSRDGLWKIMAKYKCPGKFNNSVRQFHDRMLARVQNNGKTSEAFHVSNGVKQGCVLAPTLFSFMSSAMLSEALDSSDSGIDICYRFDGSLFNLRWL